MTDQSSSAVFASALHGCPTVVVGLSGEPRPLPVDLWNPTLLDRPYVATWWTISAIVVLLVAVTGFVRSRRTRPEE